MLSSCVVTGAFTGPWISGRSRRTAMMSAAKTTKTWLQLITPRSALGEERPDHLPGGPGGGGDAEGHRAPFGRGGAADDGEDDAEAGAGDAEADQDVEELVRAGGHGIGREHQAGGVERAPRARSRGGRRSARRWRRRSAGRCPRRGSGWRSRARSRRAASRNPRRSGSGRPRSSRGWRSPPAGWCRPPPGAA